MMPVFDARAPCATCSSRALLWVAIWPMLAAGLLWRVLAVTFAPFSGWIAPGPAFAAPAFIHYGPARLNRQRRRSAA